MIKAIETEYNGYKFRSRLEARWAVFFDYLGISYEYEPEGFQMDDTTCYLPDFYIPEWDAYIEVKGNRPNVANELKKTVKFVNHSLNRVLILSDIPDGSEGLYWFPMIWFNSLTELVNSYWVGLAGHVIRAWDDMHHENGLAYHLDEGSFDCMQRINGDYVITCNGDGKEIEEI